MEKESNIKRHYVTRTLQTLFIFGLNADYINAFFEMLKTEELEYEELPMAIRFNRKSKWENKIYTVKTRDEFDFSENLFALELDKDILADLKLDLRPWIAMAHGLTTGAAESGTDEPFRFEGRHLNLVDWNEIYLEAMNHKIAKGFFNLLGNGKR